ncbi:MAG TPA: carboxylating nicotinate-nucleotide diphosphorylase, partial [Candidatus Thermoplasmatota archaeon]|nr:carboxylating nicotinate-nucleotide diphosphorylase [Candidatus Thermoplasmatota archaeon]
MDDLERFLREDLGERRDITTQALFGRRTPRVGAILYAREPVVAAGVREAGLTFERLGCRVTFRAPEGRWHKPDRPLLKVRGPLARILMAERLALNFLGRMSGIATTTRRLTDIVRKVNPDCRVAGTRKTTPGFRAYEKRAIGLGGGEPHRAGLYDAILIKDNHLEALGDVGEAVGRARAAKRGPVEIEVGNVRDALEAARAGAAWLLIDNLAPKRAGALIQKVRMQHPDVRFECSGGITEANILAYARHANRVSLGALTHS